MTLSSWGWTGALAAAFDQLTFPGAAAGRVIEEHRDAYRLAVAGGERIASLAGRLRVHAEGPLHLPCVGDWAVYTPFDSEGALIHAVLPRRSLLARKSAGRYPLPQSIAANVDVTFIVTAPNADFNVRRLERAIALVREGGIEPIVVLNKSDLCADLAQYFERAKTIRTRVIAVCATDGRGFTEFDRLLEAAGTYAFIGMSGVGKSTLVNRLLGYERLTTQQARESDDRGRHTTTTRCMVRLPGGALMIDTPGMRELGMLAGAQVVQAFEEVADIAGACRFHDCNHLSEPGCAVREAVGKELDADRLASYQKLLRESAYIERKSDPGARAAYVRRFRQLSAGAELDKRLKRSR